MASLPGCVSNITEKPPLPLPTFSVKCLLQFYTLYIRRTGIKSVPNFPTLPHKTPQTDFPKFSRPYFLSLVFLTRPQQTYFYFPETFIKIKTRYV
nr:MAG TPA: hypothetical protein [Caudoviricetes sp.]